MSDGPHQLNPVAAVEALDQELKEFQGVVTAIREAIKAQANAHAVATGKPVSPGLLMSALLSEAANVCTLWGMGRQLQPNDIEDVFSQALRNARRVLRGNLHQLVQGTSEQN